VGLGLNGDGDDRLVGLDFLKQHRVFGGAQGVAGRCILEPDHAYDAARSALLDPLAFVGVHEQDARHLLLALERGL